VAGQKLNRPPAVESEPTTCLSDQGDNRNWTDRQEISQFLESQFQETRTKRNGIQSFSNSIFQKWNSKQVFRRPTEMVKEKRKICSCKWGLYTIPPKVYRKQNIWVSSYCPVHLSYTRTHAHTHSHTHACTHIHTHARYNQERANKKTIHFPTVAGRNHCTCLLTINTPCLASTHPHFLTAGCIPWHQYPTPYSTPLSPFWELLRALHIPPSPKRQNATG
jgi:hypothetical protein